MPHSELLKKVADYCWNVFRKFFQDHAEDFAGAPPMCGGEHDMKYYELFQTYLKLYEDVLEDYLSTIDIPIKDFYDEVREAQHETHDIYISTFIDCLLASADYESFYKVMAKEGARVAHTKESSSRHEAKAEEKAPLEEEKAEGKITAKPLAVDDDDKAIEGHGDVAEKKSSHK
eukprot:scaffold14361_cov193-Ochromonas_danica.AAC.13